MTFDFMNNEFLRDGEGRIIGRFDKNLLRDGTGKIIARYDEADNRTRDRSGRIVGSGDQRLRALELNENCK